MWYEILPSLAGMAVGLWGGWIAVPVWHYLCFGGPALRVNKGDYYSFYHIKRDNKIAEQFTGSRYNGVFTYGLEALPDEDEGDVDLTLADVKKRKNKYFMW